MRIFLGFLAYGIAVGLISVWWWNSGADMPFLLNIPGVLLGDEVYALAIEYLGNPRSSQAHYTIPWLLRVPQIYAIVSVLLWGMVGLIFQWALQWIGGPKPTQQVASDTSPRGHQSTRTDAALVMSTSKGP